MAVHSALNETLRILNEAREKHSDVLVAFSGGKDSLCVIDLCRRTFKRVVGFFMFMVPGLEVCEQQIEYAEKRWGVPIVQYPHFTLVQYLKYGAFMPPSHEFDDLPNIGLFDIYEAVRRDTGIPLIATGMKKADGSGRRTMLRATAGKADWADVIHPCVEWNKFDVLAYLRSHDIPVPDDYGGVSAGIGLLTPDVLWLHDNHPKDFEKLLNYFPYAEAIVKRRDWYGIS